MPTGFGGQYGNYPVAPGYGTPANDPIVPTDFGSWFGKVFAAFGRSWKSLLPLHALALVPALILGIAQQILLRNQLNDGVTSSGRTINVFGAATGTALLLGLLALIASVVLRAAASVGTAHIITRDAAAEATGDTTRASWGDGLRFASSRLGAMIGWSLLTGLLTGLGFIACIGPGVWLGVVFFSSLTGVVAFERGKPFERSFALIKGQWWSMFGRAMAMVGIVWGVQFVIGLVAASVFGSSLIERSTGSILGIQIISTLIGLPIAMLLSIAAVIAYAELRSKQQMTSAGLLAHEASIGQ
jgi:hypothetical protein